MNQDYHQNPPWIKYPIPVRKMLPQTNKMKVMDTLNLHNISQICQSRIQDVPPIAHSSSRDSTFPVYGNPDNQLTSFLRSNEHNLDQNTCLVQSRNVDMRGSRMSPDRGAKYEEIRRQNPLENESHCQILRRDHGRNIRDSCIRKRSLDSDICYQERSHKHDKYYCEKSEFKRSLRKSDPNFDALRSKMEAVEQIYSNSAAPLPKLGADKLSVPRMTRETPPSCGEGRKDESSSDLKKITDSLETKPRLGGAARKRLKYLVQQGLSYEEARLRALKPFRVNNSSKRNNLTKKSPKSVRRKAKRGCRTGEQSSNHPRTTASNQAKKCIKLGILHKDFPGALLTLEQLKSLEGAILKKVIQQKESAVKPQFLGSSHQQGWLLLICANLTTSEWLKGVVRELRPWEDATLVALEEKDIPKTEEMEGSFPNSATDSVEDILGLVQAQNEGLNVKKWSVLNKCLDEGTWQLTLSVDPSSSKTLKRTQGKISYKFGFTSILPKGECKEESKGDQPDKAESSKGSPASEVTVKGETISSTSPNLPNPTSTNDLK